MKVVIETARRAVHATADPRTLLDLARAGDPAATRAWLAASLDTPQVSDQRKDDRRG